MDDTLILVTIYANFQKGPFKNYVDKEWGEGVSQRSTILHKLK